jgi:RimJ/RimL family protein N-acetyltransferase
MLRTDRLIIRKFEKSDGEDLYKYLSNPDVVEYEPYEIHSLEESKKEATNRSKDNRFLAVVLKDTNTLIGNLFYKKNENDFETWEVGYVFNSNYHNKGYATESLRVLLEHIFIEQKAHRIVAFCNSHNKPSWKLLERVGFRREAHLVKQAYFSKDEQGKPKWFNTFGYALLEKEYIELNI